MKKILILEDDDYILDFLSHGLSSLGCDIKTVKDGVGGLDLIRKEKQDLLFSFYNPQIHSN